MDPPRRPAPANPPTPHPKPAPEHTGETASGSHTAAGEGTSNVFPIVPHEPKTDEMIGPYRILRELGRGGMAVVYEAQDTELPRRVALKVLLSGNADPQGKLRFVREAHAQAKITHDHVVTIYRVGEARGVSYIAMPVLNGQTLAQALSATPRPPVSHVVRIGGEIAEGLAAAHAAGLIHRDIKPSNIWLEAPKWRVKILDFGLARDPHATTASAGDITIDGHVVGTPAYMSPEQAAGHAVDHRTDLWSLGVVLYQMTTGQKPFTGASTLNLMTAIISVEPPAPVELAPDVPPALSALILRLLAKHPDDRPASADEVVAQLDAIARSQTAAPVFVVWHPTNATTPAAAPNPWSDIESTEGAALTPRTTRTRREPEEEDPRRSRRDSEARSLKWVWIGGGTALLAVLLGGLVWLAVAAVSPKTKPTEQVEKPPAQPKPVPTPVPAPKSVPDSERSAAEQLLPEAKLKLLPDNGPEVEVGPGGTLPAGKFTVQVIDFESNKGLDANFVTRTFLPAVTNLKGLAEVRMDRWQMELSAEHVRQLAAMPLTGTLSRLDAAVELTPASLNELKKFRHLDDLTVVVPEPDDALFARLAELCLQPRHRQNQCERTPDAREAFVLVHVNPFIQRVSPIAARAR